MKSQESLTEILERERQQAIVIAQVDERVYKDTPYERTGVNRQVIDVEIEKHKAEVQAYEARTGEKWYDSPKNQARVQRAQSLIRSLNSTQHPSAATLESQLLSPEDNQKIAIATKSAEDQSVQMSLEMAAAIGDKHDLMSVSQATLFTLRRATDMYGSNVIRHFEGLPVDALSLGLRQLMAVVSQRAYVSEGEQAYRAMTPEQIAQHDIEHAELSKKLDEARRLTSIRVVNDGGEPTVDGRGAVASEYRAEHLEGQENSLRSSFIDGNTLMIGLWALSSMTVLASTEGEKAAADDAIGELEQAIAEQKNPIVIDSELNKGEFIDILPPALGKLAVSAPAL